MSAAQSFEVFAATVLDQRESDGIRGIARERSRYRVHVATASFATMPLDQIEPKHIADWLRDMSVKQPLDKRGLRKLSRDEVHAPVGAVHMFLASNARQRLAQQMVCRQIGRMTSTRGTRYDPTPEYRAWLSMKARCSIPSASHYSEYGGRGIVVCDRWRESFEAFLADVGPRPTPRHSIDRINVDGNYEPANVRWATREEQHRNKRNNRFLEIDGERLCITDWARRSPVTLTAIIRRLDAGWTTKDAVFAPNQNDGDRPLRKAPDFVPWNCLGCGATKTDCKAPNLRLCATCKPTHERMQRAGGSLFSREALELARAHARAARRERKGRR